MRFGPVPVVEAEGAVLAHSLFLGSLRLKKGRRLSAADLHAMAEAGLDSVVVARLDTDDLAEDDAALALGEALATDPEALGLTRSAPFTGRLNFFAAAAGLLRVDREAVDRFNAIDPAITLATLTNYSRVEARGMVATVKIIPYAASRAAVGRACASLSGPPLRLLPFRPFQAGLILTQVTGTKPALVEKGVAAVAKRIHSLGGTLAPPASVPHHCDAVAAALREVEGNPILILTASATSDAADTGPAALLAAGGHLHRFGMPVDPGNLLFFGALGDRAVVGLPGCVRSPALNGADWVLERLAARLTVTASDIAGMGVGGLLKEIPIRPQPRAGRAASASARPRVEVLLLAAGSARRMGGRDKLLEPVAGEPILRRTARMALSSGAERTLAVLPSASRERCAALSGLPVDIVEAPAASEGMAGSLRTGLSRISESADALVLLFADMPEVSPAHIDRLIAAFDPAEGREICRAIDEEGRPGHPVLFGRRFFESLAALEGDRGARNILNDAEEHLVDVPTPGRGATLDLDTPAAWRAWRANAERIP